MANQLWAFQWNNADNNYNVKDASNVNSTIESHPPTLVPPNTTLGISTNKVNSTPKITTVDVVNDYYWTYSPLSDKRREEVPKIIMQEKRLKTNAMIAQIVASFNTSIEGVGNTITSLENSSLGRSEQGRNFINVLKNLATGAQNAAYYALGAGATALGYTPTTQIAGGTANSNQKSPQQEDTNVTAGKEIAKNLFNKIKSVDNNPVLQTDLLKAYLDLYPTVDTGWRYKLPYFDNYYSSSFNQFGEEPAGNILNLLRSGGETLTSIASIAGALQQPFGFSFQERAKFFNFPTEGEEISFSFPLINTGSATFDDVIKNWQLIFLLLYQNKPARLNRSIIEPPVIYQVEIPAQKFYPFCYISNLSVEFKGSRRELTFPLTIQNTSNSAIPVTEESIENEQIVNTVTQNARIAQFNAIIPDAYMVKITLKSLLAETRNFMVYSLLAGGRGNTTTNIVNLDKTANNVRSSALGASDETNVNLPLPNNINYNSDTGTVNPRALRQQ